MSPAAERVSAEPVGSQRTERVVARIAEAVGDPLVALGLDLEATELTPGGKRRVLRIAVDKDGGVTLDDIAEAARTISEVLDGSDALGEQPYTLEVTSRGVDRPLTQPRHWRRNRDRLVKVSLTEGDPVTGRIGECDDTGVDLDVSGTARRVQYAEVSKALVQVEFNRRPPADEPDPGPRTPTEREDS